MAGIVYLRTNQFEVKLEGITFKTNDFESLCAVDFLFPGGKVWNRPPIVGLDVMHHPRDPSVLLVLLCFGVGCVILKFRSGEELPYQIRKFLGDKRIRFVGFGIPEKKDVFPFRRLGLAKSEVDIGYLAAKVLKDKKCKRWELSQLARKVLGIKRMIALTDSTSLERHEQIKCAICQLFITSLIAMGLTRANDKKKPDESPKRGSFLKNLNSLHLLAEGWFKLRKSRKENQAPDHARTGEDVWDLISGNVVDKPAWVSPVIDPRLKNDDFLYVYSESDSEDDAAMELSDDSSKEWACSDHDKDGCGGTGSVRLKGILKGPSVSLRRLDSSPLESVSPASTSHEEMAREGRLRRANSKGFNVTFNCE